MCGVCATLVSWRVLHIRVVSLGGDGFNVNRPVQTTTAKSFSLYMHGGFIWAWMVTGTNGTRAKGAPVKMGALIQGHAH